MSDEATMKQLYAVGQILVSGRVNPKKISKANLQAAIDDPIVFARNIENFLADGAWYDKSPEKFALLMDLGEIIVPHDYDHAMALSMFKEKNSSRFIHFSFAIRDEWFPNPDRILIPGNKFWVRAFKQIVPGTTTSEERMAFLATQNSVHTGAQGLSLVCDQKHDQLPKERGYSSFDEPSRLLCDVDDYHLVPHVEVNWTGDLSFKTRAFEMTWHDQQAFLCFNEVSPT